MIVKPHRAVKIAMHNPDRPGDRYIRIAPPPAIPKQLPVSKVCYGAAQLKHWLGQAHSMAY
jgi:hypothetical protein